MKFLGNVTFKLLILIFILSGTLSYSIYIKKNYQVLEAESLTPILKSIPEVGFHDLLSQKNVNLKDQTLITKKGSFVHFWGTWCSPCEEELPSFIELGKKFEGAGQKFFLIAVNDSKKELKKFLKRFKGLPSNMKVLLDNSGKLMSSFGVVKVPETFVFDKNGQSLKKFSGPQNWEYPYYLQSINDLFRKSLL